MLHATRGSLFSAVWISIRGLHCGVLRRLLFSSHLLPRRSYGGRSELGKSRGVLALAAVGVGIASLNDSDSEASVSVSPPLRELLLQSWKSLHLDTPKEYIWNHFSGSGHLPLHFNRTGVLPSTDFNKEASESAGNHENCCKWCVGRDSFAAAAATAGPAVVNISVTRGFHGMIPGKSFGCGTIIDPDGTILTCAHIVVDFESPKTVPKGKVDVTLQDGQTFEGTLVNADLHSDIAVIKINSKTPLPAARLGSSFKLRPGDWVVALGSPLSLQNTITAGIVSCVDRKSGDFGPGGKQREYLQTDCAIDRGNSGGPLVNLDGEVVGVNIIKIWPANRLGLAVPIDSAAKIVEQFRKNGRVVRPWLGLPMLDLNQLNISQIKERDPSFPNVSKGVLVPMVTPGSLADCAGFWPGDVVIEFDGRPVGSIKEIIEVMGDKAGIPMKVLVKRANNKMVTLTVVPEEANPDT